MMELFGYEFLKDASLDRHWFPLNFPVVLKPKKIQSIAKQYFSIPEVHRWYYPECSQDNLDNLDDGDEDELPRPAPKKRKKTTPAVAPKAPGRPKRKLAEFDKNQPTLFSLYFVKKTW